MAETDYPFAWIRDLDNDELETLVRASAFEQEVRKRAAPMTCPCHVGARFCKLVAGHGAPCDFPTVEERAAEVARMVRSVIEDEEAVQIEVRRRAEELSR